MSKKNIMQLPQYDIGLIFLEKLKEIEKDYLEISVFDLSVTRLTFPSTSFQKRIKKEGKTIFQTTYIPEIVFNLKSIDDTSVSLIEVLLPNHNILCSTAKLKENESIKEVKDGKEIYTKMVFDLFTFTRKSLLKTTQTYEQYQTELTTLKISHKKDLDNLRESYEKRIENMLQPYKTIENKLREELASKDDEINRLLIEIPNNMNQKIKNFVMKVGSNIKEA